MDLWLILVLYVAGLGLVVAETLLPGVVLGLIGAGLIVTSTVFGFRYHWVLGAGQTTIAVVAMPLCFWIGLRRLSLRTALDEGKTFARDWSAYAGREGEALTDLRPAGIVMIDGRKVDVVTGGELVAKGRRVRVVTVEGNRIVVRSTQEAR